jgi:NAD(P)-dependent dehydrogenase (short-subunit alcohol dehydrogenase family)
VRLAGKTAIITGAGGDLGRGTAVRLTEEGARVLVNDIRLERAEETVAMVTGAGGEAMANAADITDAEAVGAMVEQALSAWGQVDILVNNAGDIRDSLIAKMSEEAWDWVLDLNLKGSFLCTRAVAPHMIERTSGRIVNLSSLAYKGNIGQANYVSAKSGIIGLTQASGLEFARYGISVNCVAPGLIDTPKTDTLDEATRERLVRLTPMRRMGEIVDIANAILFFVSDEAKYVTRQVIHVSGGMEGF